MVPLSLVLGERWILTVGLPMRRFASYTSEPQERWDGVSYALCEIRLISSTSIWLFKSNNCGKSLENSPWGISTSYLETQTEFYEQKICWEACLPHLL